MVTTTSLAGDRGRREAVAVLHGVGPNVTLQTLISDNVLV